MFSVLPDSISTGMLLEEMVADVWGGFSELRFS
jgi:hypothetical protein